MSRVLGRVLGIDLGTTQSRVAVIDGGAPVTIANAEGGPATPAVVAFRGQSADEIWVGSSAAEQVRANPRSTIRAIKRLMGRKIDDPEVRRHRQDVSYEIIAAREGEACVRVRGRRYTPAEIVALILRDLKAQAERALGEPATHAVISVPSYFDEVQRQATRQAAALAGLDLLRLVNDPTAVALAYGQQGEGGGEGGDGERERGEQRIAIYNLGGGCFDLTLLTLRGDSVETNAIWGDGFLGGEDFDQRIAAHLADAFQSKHGLDLRPDDAAMQQLKRLAVAAKHALSDVDSTEINLPVSVGATPPPPPPPAGATRRPPRRRQGTPHALSVTLTRAELESLTKDLVDRTLFPCEAALEDAGWTAADVGVVLIAGAQGRMPRARAMLGEVFGKRPIVVGDDAAAVGAAIVGDRLRAGSAGAGIVERVAISLGVETAGGVFTRLLPKNTPLPAARTQLFSTVADAQKQIVIHVVQGEREMAADNKSLGRYRIAPLPPARRGEPQIEVQVSMDASGLVAVAASDLQTGERQDITLAPAPAVPIGTGG
ncbi:MAG TPA: Hsp70 family protein [Polyangia bacterium]|nr:Hsp70 family protein [Polyangia bacterium]